MAYDYEGSVDFSGDTARALEYAGNLLGAKGFRVLPPAGNQLWFTNPSSYLNTKKQPLLMVSKGCLAATGTSLTLQAELGNLQTLVKFLVLLLTVMAIPETVLIAAVMVMMVKQPELLWVCVTPIAPVPFILLFMPKIQGGITGRALDALLNEAAAAGGGESTTAPAMERYVDSKTGRRYWFRAKRKGWGWDLPLTWEGWLVTAVIIAAAAGGEMALPPNPFGLSVLYMAGIVVLLLVICLSKGEPPGWRRGDPDDRGRGGKGS
jgi:hypothetical protein